MHHVDWVATFAVAAGVNTSDLDPDSDSVSHWRHITGAVEVHDTGAPRDTIFHDVSANSCALRRGDLKLLYSVTNATYNTASAKFTAKKLPSTMRITK